MCFNSRLTTIIHVLYHMIVLPRFSLMDCTKLIGSPHSYTCHNISCEDPCARQALLNNQQAVVERERNSRREAQQAEFAAALAESVAQAATETNFAGQDLLLSPVTDGPVAVHVSRVTTAAACCAICSQTVPPIAISDENCQSESANPLSFHIETF